MPDSPFRMTGGDEIAARLQSIAQASPKQRSAALRTEGEVEMTEMKRRTPVDKGPLRASGYVKDVESSTTRSRLELGFGGPSAPYAVYVHEDLDALHSVGQAKFAESVLLESAPFMLQRIANRLDLGKKS